jgi:hypothetical protein
VKSQASRTMWTGTILARTAVLLPVTMAAWWFLLKQPSLWLLEKLAYIPLALLVAPAGLAPIQINPLTHDWTFSVAVNTYARNAQTGETLFIRSLDFTAGEDGVAYFASGWLAYLALAAAAGAFTRSELPQVAKGLAIVTAVNILSLAAYAYINGYGSVINSPGGSNGYLWLLKYLYHLIYLVVPFAGPFAVAVMQHRRWRECFGSSAGSVASGGLIRRPDRAEA